MYRPGSNIVILTRYHSITGTTDLGDQRLSDVLNDEQHSSIRLRDACIARIDCPGEPIGQQPVALVAKEQIVAAFEKEPPPRTTKRLFGYVKKTPHPVFLVLEGIEVRGVIHTAGGLELSDIYRFVVNQRERFLPVTQSVVSFCTDENLTMRPDVVIVNMHKLQYMAKLPEAGPASPSS